MFSPFPERLKLQPKSPTLPILSAMGRMLMAQPDSHLHFLTRMFFTEDGSMFDPFRPRDKRNTILRNAPVWALLIGETYATAVHAQAHRRPHRTMLPDVDFSRQAVHHVAGAPDDSMSESPYVATDRVADSDNSEMRGSMRPLAA